MVEHIPAITGLVVALGGAVAAVARPICKHLTERKYVERAEPKDLPDLAKALHPQIEVRRNGKRQPEPPVDGGGESAV